MNAIVHHQNVKQLHSVIEQYEKKLDDKVDEMFHHVPTSITRFLTNPRILTKLYFHRLKIKKRTSLSLRRKWMFLGEELFPLGLNHLLTTMKVHSIMMCHKWTTSSGLSKIFTQEMWAKGVSKVWWSQEVLGLSADKLMQNLDFSKKSQIFSPKNKGMILLLRKIQSGPRNWNWACSL